MRHPMRHRWIHLIVTALLLTACAPPGTTPTSREPGHTQPADFLPTLADYAMADDDSWAIQQRVEAGRIDTGLLVESWPHRTDPPGCDDPPYGRIDGTAAETVGREINLGPVGLGSEVSIRIIRGAATTLLSDTRDWAKRCRDTRLMFDEDGGNPYVRPTAISVLPQRDVDGVEVLRILLTDNRENRFQTEGTRDRIVSLASVNGLTVYEHSHGAGELADRLLALTIRRLLTDTPPALPEAHHSADSSLARRSDIEIARLLPPITRLQGNWALTQALPVLHARPEYYLPEPAISPTGCDASPFNNISNLAPRADLNRGFREVATATAAKPGQSDYLAGAFDSFRNTDDTVRLGIEGPGVDVIAETAAWARRCATYTETGPPEHKTRGTVELLPIEPPAGVDDIVSVHLAQTGTYDPDLTASIMRIRGLLVVTLPAVGRQSSPLFEQTLTNLRNAEFTETPPPTRPPEPDYEAEPPGRVALPAPTDEATERLGRVATGTLVDSEPYHFSGYMPGDAKVRSPDTLYFHSPTGSINCAFRQHYGGLTCAVPAGSYPRNPTPADARGTWFDDYVHFGRDTITNGMSAYLPYVDAEATVLPYGSTIRLTSDAPNGGTECLMARDGLTCVDYDTRVGLHLSRDDLTPLVGTEALRIDDRNEPG
ncbi:hypothetical protein KIH27_05285 [Mycobacterium sp. M1]|uniref:Uncharacterized protein n=1 Tax=Mycolicibacter acidiphilus TaxID=2835306 RepID=A0ABS5RHR9_9MYCO|nr:hypothetical protein [Mycolicibacter acidiphilus]MBS9533001.1 hypothetical protein [Mycolicibacter acidiphilus]